MLSIKQTLSKNYINARGWRTKRKLLLIESDDWGAIRTPSKKAFDFFLSNNIAVDHSYFDRYDSLESSEDLENLFEVLDGFHDKNGNPAIITAFSLVVNPAFEKIEADKRQQYHYELITDTYKRHKHTDRSFPLFMQGIESRLIHPQFHGREHINVKRWLEAINSPSIMHQKAFEMHALIGAKHKTDSFKYPFNVFAAFDKSQESEIQIHKEIISDGINLFKNIFGFKSLSFIAPTGVWHDYIHETLYNSGVRLNHGRQAILINNKFKFINKVWGVKDDLGLLYWRRNCSFEPSRNQNYDWVNHCLKEIEIAYRWNKPAVINCHRVNFIGSIFPENRKQSLHKLKLLLCTIKKRWPEVEFICTHELAEIMVNELS